MAISRDPRNNRRRRILRENSAQQPSQTARKKSSAKSTETPDTTQRRSAGYSQDVRRACGVRLVQLIPIRKRSFVLAVAASLIVPAILVTLHYLIFVSGVLEWYGHPLVAALDLDDRRSIASWLNSQLWMLCLGATLLTFQLRRHKLDDYDGEYRLWFWMVLTCLFASFDSTSHATELFGIALHSWSVENLGWSGPAVVSATLAVLVGILGLRLCTELKVVPSSTVFWLVGLVCWAGSAALAQEEFKINLSIQHRVWLKATLWTGGLTCIWLAALGYLRYVYIEAQQRFLARGLLARRNAQPGIPLRQRVQESGQRFRESLPSFRRRSDEDPDSEANEAGWRSRLPGLGNWNGESAEERAERRAEARAAKAKHKQALSEQRELEKLERQEARAKSANERKNQRASRVDDQQAQDEKPAGRRRGLGSFLSRKVDSNSGPSASNEPMPEEAKEQRRTVKAQRDEDGDEDADTNKASMASRMTGWLRRPKDSEDADEYRKVKREPQANKPKKQRPSEEAADDEETEGGKRSWFRRRGKTDVSSEDENSETQQEKGGFFSRFKLQPPEESDTSSTSRDAQAPFPSTSSRSADDEGTFADDSDDEDRQLSRAERKRQRKQKRRRAA